MAENIGPVFLYLQEKKLLKRTQLTLPNHKFIVLHVKADMSTLIRIREDS